jgi:hypothetical protein
MEEFYEKTPHGKLSVVGTCLLFQYCATDINGSSNFRGTSFSNPYRGTGDSAIGLLHD